MRLRAEEKGAGHGINPSCHDGFNYCRMPLFLPIFAASSPGAAMYGLLCSLVGIPKRKTRNATSKPHQPLPQVKPPAPQIKHSMVVRNGMKRHGKKARGIYFLLRHHLSRAVCLPMPAPIPNKPHIQPLTSLLLSISDPATATATVRPSFHRSWPFPNHPSHDIPSIHPSIHPVRPSHQHQQKQTTLSSSPTVPTP